MTSITLNELNEFLLPPAAALRLDGFHSGLCSYLLTQCAAKTLNSAAHGPILVICPDLETIEQLKVDLHTFGAVAHVFPTWELSPYAGFNPSIEVRNLRLKAMTLITTPLPPKTPVFILTTLPALIQVVPPTSAFKDSLFSFQRASDISSREDVAEKLVSSGYLRVDTVEDPGTFSIRGEIIDVFSPHQNRPYRIELFDTAIEKIRFFLPETQRTLPEEFPEALITPAREVFLQPENILLLKEKIKEHCDQLGIRRNFRDSILELIQGQHASEWLDCYVPFAYETPACLFDYICSSVQLIAWVDEFSCFQNWEKNRNSMREDSAGNESLTRVLPHPDLLFPEKHLDKVRSTHKRKLFFDRIFLDSEKSEPAHRYHLEQQIIRDFPEFQKNMPQRIRDWVSTENKISIFTPTRTQLERAKSFLESLGILFSISPETSGVNLIPHPLSGGFILPEIKQICLTDDELFGCSPKSRRPSDDEGREETTFESAKILNDLFEGDSVVHRDHGVGIYRGIMRIKTQEVDQDFIQIEYANQDKLYLPVYRLNLLQKYISDGEHTTLDRLGSRDFEKAKEKAKESAKKIAFDLVELYAKRALQRGVAFSPRDSLLTEFEETFPYRETPDQLNAIRSTYKDLQSGKIMDRLVCGDVGFGKTEVAIRAAFKVASEGKQVAVLVPTTLLCQQHEESFKKRFKGYPFVIESISRFKSTKSQREIIDGIGEGKIDILIGTHRILSKDVSFKDLGLIIIDEEHRFGVEQKEKLKMLRTNTHVLSLTATPIPRTLSMALSGLREISIINTPPVNRLPIRNSISRFEDSIIKSAIDQELNRGGQVFFLHNRVQTIHKIEERLRKIVPQARILVAHGQLSEVELEKKMISFYKHEADILLCTTIIESGLDIPNANTIIIDRADRFGLSQLYQIRGRVGRSDRRAYAYLLIPEEGAISGESQKRLEIIQRFVELGSGFNIASHDLELRGGGDFLGASQSGHILAVGFELYTELLNEAILELQGKPEQIETKTKEPEIKTPYPSFLPEGYVPDPHHRISLYRRLSAAKNEDALHIIEEELKDRFGAPPIEAENLFWIIRIKQILSHLNFDALTVGPEKLTLSTSRESAIDPTRVIALVASNKERYQFSGDSRLVVKVSTHSAQELFREIEKLTKLMVA